MEKLRGLTTGQGLLSSAGSAPPSASSESTECLAGDSPERGRSPSQPSIEAGLMGGGAPFLSLDAFSARFDSRQTTGIVLAVGGNLLVSVALNLTKHAHNVNQKRSVPLPYIRLPIWWCGFAATLLGELGNFAAYGFTEASVIAPLVSEPEPEPHPT